MHRLILPAVLFLSACNGTTDTDEPVASSGGLPTGTSAWTGSGEVNGLTFLVDATLDNVGGDLTGTVTVRDSPEAPVGVGEGTYAVSGTHEPVSGLVALAPDDWIEMTDFQIEVLGLLGTYDAETGEIDGTLGDYATADDNVLRGGPITLVLESGDGEPLQAGDEALSLPVDEAVTFVGSHRCSSSQREATATLTYDGEGFVSGTLSYGDLTLVDGTNTFEVTGVHNPSTGGVTLMPGLYTETGGNSYLTFYLDGTFDPAAGSLDGQGRTTLGACPTRDGFVTQIETEG